MGETVPSDHDSVTAYRVALSSIGATSRLEVGVPAECGTTPGSLISLSLGETTTWAVPEETLDGSTAIRGSFPNRRQARAGEGTNRFEAWLDAKGLRAGDTLVLDCLRSGWAYGLRKPGDRVLYRPPAQPDQSLADIARSLDSDT